MNTAMSTKRFLVAPSQKSLSGVGISVLTLVAGLALMVAGIALDNSMSATIGFLFLTPSLMYLNCIFWAKMYENGKFPVSESQIKRYY